MEFTEKKVKIIAIILFIIMFVLIGILIFVPAPELEPETSSPLEICFGQRSI